MSETYSVSKRDRGGYVVMRHSPNYADEPVYATKKDGMTQTRDNKPVARVFATEEKAQSFVDGMGKQNTSERTKQLIRDVAARLKSRERDSGRGL